MKAPDPQAGRPFVGSPDAPATDTAPRSPPAKTRRELGRRRAKSWQSAEAYVLRSSNDVSGATNRLDQGGHPRRFKLSSQLVDEYVDDIAGLFDVLRIKML